MNQQDYISAKFEIIKLQQKNIAAKLEEMDSSSSSQILVYIPKCKETQIEFNQWNFNILYLNSSDHSSTVSLLLNHNLFALNSLISDSNIIDQFIIKKTEDNISKVFLKDDLLVQERDEYFNLQIINNIKQIEDQVKISVRFLDDRAKLLFSRKVVDVQNIVKRSLSRIPGFTTQTIFLVNILGISTVMQITNLTFQQNWEVQNQMMCCNNINFLEIQIDYTSLFKFSCFYHNNMKNQLFLSESSKQERNNLEKVLAWISILSSDQIDFKEEFSVFERESKVIYFQGEVSQNLKKKNFIFQLKRAMKQISNHEVQSQLINQIFQSKRMKVRYLDLKNIISTTNQQSFKDILKELKEIIFVENKSSKKYLFFIDSCENILLQDKKSQNQSQFNELMKFCETIPSILFVEKSKKQIYFSVPSKIGEIYI